MLKTDKFYKLKIGIDKPQHRLYNTNYVIDYFTKEQQYKIESCIKKIVLKMKTNNFFYILENMNE
jgi:peptidyl-tRNA hydrolase